MIKEANHIEDFIGVSGSMEGLAQLPDGKFLPPFELNDAENIFKAAVELQFPGRKVIPARVANLSEARPKDNDLGRGQCQVRSLCERGCSFKAYHSSLNTSLPAAERTGNLTLITDALVHSIIHDPERGKATGVRVVDRNTMETTIYEAKIIFSNASALGTAQILLNSTSEAFPNGLANSSDQVGRNIMDHLYALSTAGIFPMAPTPPTAGADRVDCISRVSVMSVKMHAITFVATVFKAARLVSAGARRQTVLAWVKT